jgi:hypothetical protein
MLQLPQGIYIERSLFVGVNVEAKQLLDCAHDCPCDEPKQGVQSQRQPTRSIVEVETK